MWHTGRLSSMCVVLEITYPIAPSPCDGSSGSSQWYPKASALTGQPQGFPKVGPYGLGPYPSVAEDAASFVPPPPPLPAHLSRLRASGATHSQTIAVEVNGQLKERSRGVLDSPPKKRVLSAERSGVQHHGGGVNTHRGSNRQWGSGRVSDDRSPTSG